MKFELFKCKCGYREITPSTKPVCLDCGKKLSVMTDPTERDQFDKEIKGLLRDLSQGKPVPRRHHDQY